MKVEIWSDFVCPFCYIGKRRFERALEQFANKNDVEVIYKSFELDPNAAKDGNPNVVDMLAAKYGMTKEQAKQNLAHVTKQANELGLDYKMEQSIQTNTFDAHRLAHFAASKGKLEEMTERLLKAHFIDSLHVGDHDVLADLAAEIGLDREEVTGVLKENSYADAVRADEKEAAAIGVRGVPFFVIDRKYAISGAQPSELFLETLQKAWNEAHPLTVVQGDGADGEVCTDDGCAVPEKKEG